MPPKNTKRSLNLLLLIILSIINYSYAYAATPIISTYSTDFFKAFYQYRYLEDHNCQMKSSNILTVYVCNYFTKVISSSQINGLYKDELFAVVNEKIIFFDVEGNHAVLLDVKNSLSIITYSNSSLKLKSHDFSHDKIPLDLKIRQFKEKNEQIIFLYTLLDNNNDINSPIKVTLIEIDEYVIEHEFDIGLYNRTTTIKYFDIKKNIQTGNYFIVTMLSNNTFMIYECNNTTSLIKFSKSFSSDADYKINILMSENYLLFMNATLYPGSLYSYLQVELYQLTDIISDTFRNQSYCSFSVGMLSKYFEVHFNERNDYLTLIINNQSSSVLVYNLGMPNSSMFCKHIILQNIFYESSKKKCSLGFYQNDKQNMPVLIFQDEHGSYPFFFKLCLPGFFFHPLYQSCIKCDQNYFSIGAKETHCTWCDGYYLDIIINNPIVSQIFTLDTFYIVSEGCYAQKESSILCLDCMHSFHTEMKSKILIDNSHILSPVDPKSKDICRTECKGDFLTEIKQGPTTERLNIDKCARINDCYDCNAADNCVWCNNYCTSVSNCDIKSDIKKKDSMAEYLGLFQNCPSLPICGQDSNFIGDSTLIEIHNNTFKKNSVCKWSVYFESELGNTISEIDLSLQNYYYPNISNYIGFYIHFCYFQLGMKRCNLERLPIGKKATNYPLRSYLFQIYMVVNNDIENNETQIQLSYKKIGTDYYNIPLVIIACITILLMFLILIICIVMICKRCSIRLRSFRFLRQRALNDEEAVNLSIDLPSSQSWQIMLSNIKFSQKDNEFNQIECCFCLELFKNDEVIVKLHCKHIFHSKCFENWVRVPNQSQTKCPLCTRVAI